jgi:hypothetical protein
VDLAGTEINADVFKRHRLAKRFSDADNPSSRGRLSAFFALFRGPGDGRR